MSSETLNIEKIRSEKIRDIFIIHKTGQSLYHRAYVKSKVDEDLLSGFLTAIFHLSEELSLDKIHVMDMKDFKFIYENKDPHIFILNVPKDVDPQFGKNILDQIVDYFFEIYNTFDDHTKSQENLITQELKYINFGEKLDYFVNNTLIEYYFQSPAQILKEIESFLKSLFGTMGKELIESSIKESSIIRKNITFEDIESLISTIQDSLTKKMNSQQAKNIIKQIKDTFLPNISK